MRRPASPARAMPSATWSCCSRADRRRRHAAAIVGRSKEREAAPAAADLQHVIVRTERQLVADCPQLVDLRRLERVVRGLEHRAGVHQSRVEKQPEELVAQVVVFVNVAAAARRRVVAPAVRQALERARNPRRHRRQRPDDVAVGEHEADEADEVRRRPVPIHVGIAKADLATGDHPPEEAAVVDLDRGRQSACGAERA